MLPKSTTAVLLKTSVSLPAPPYILSEFALNATVSFSASCSILSVVVVALPLTPPGVTRLIVAVTLCVGTLVSISTVMPSFISPLLISSAVKMAVFVTFAPGLKGSVYVSSTVSPSLASSSRYTLSLVVPLLPSIEFSYLVKLPSLFSSSLNQTPLIPFVLICASSDTSTRSPV